MEKVIQIKENVYHPASNHDYQNNHDVDEEIRDETHKPYYVPVKDFSDEYKSNYDTVEKSDFINDSVDHEVLDEVFSDEVPNYFDNSIVVTENNEPYIDATKASEEVISDYEYQQVYSDSVTSEPHKNVIRGVDNNDIQNDISTENLELKNTEVPGPLIEDNSDTQYKSELPNTNFRSDFFNSENIENVVFSIPAQFRAFLQEPPDWIN